MNTKLNINMCFTFYLLFIKGIEAIQLHIYMNEIIRGSYKSLLFSEALLDPKTTALIQYVV
jgi:hypothetical protein